MGGGVTTVMEGTTLRGGGQGCRLSHISTIYLVIEGSNDCNIPPQKFHQEKV